MLSNFSVRLEIVSEKRRFFLLNERSQYTKWIINFPPNSLTSWVRTLQEVKNYKVCYDYYILLKG